MTTPGLTNLWSLTTAETRSISAENPDGSRGGGAKEPVQPGTPSSHLGTGWKVRPCVTIPAGETFEVANIEGPGCIRHIWMTCLIQNEANPVP